MNRRAAMTYYVVQEGGSSRELYLSTFNRERDAKRYRRSCAKASYRTSPIGRLPTKVLDVLSAFGDPEMFDAVFALASAAQEVDYP